MTLAPVRWHRCMRGAIMAAGPFCRTFWASKKYERKEDAPEQTNDLACARHEASVLSTIGNTAKTCTLNTSHQNKSLLKNVIALEARVPPPEVFSRGHLHCTTCKTSLQSLNLNIPKPHIITMIL
jgi:hypothetical protein